MHVSYLDLTAARHSACFRVSLCSRNSRSQAVIPHFDSLLQMSAWAGLFFAVTMLSVALAVRDKKTPLKRHPQKRTTPPVFDRLMFKFSPPILFASNQEHPVPKHSKGVSHIPWLIVNSEKEGSPRTLQHLLHSASLLAKSVNIILYPLGIMLVKKRQTG